MVKYLLTTKIYQVLIRIEVNTTYYATKNHKHFRLAK